MWTRLFWFATQSIDAINREVGLPVDEILTAGAFGATEFSRLARSR